MIAVDPTSPYTGGALLGDRIRMNEVATGEGVFIWSMATRGALGGIAMATAVAMDVLAAFGFDVIIVETVGVPDGERVFFSGTTAGFPHDERLGVLQEVTPSTPQS